MTWAMKHERSFPRFLLFFFLGWGTHTKNTLPKGRQKVVPSVPHLGEELMLEAWSPPLTTER